MNGMRKKETRTDSSTLIDIDKNLSENKAVIRYDKVVAQF